MQETTVTETIDCFLAQADRIWREWSNAQRQIATIWFRGHAEANWTLIPGKYRPLHRRFSEHRYRHDFLLRAAPFLAEATVPPSSDWDWYFLMQHFGVPTRLLDWTESALVAAFFATQETSAGGDGVVWVFDARALNGLSESCGQYVPVCSHVAVEPYLNALWDERTDRTPDLPLAIDPPHNSHRLAAQRGKFTVHGRKHDGIESLDELKGGLVKLLIPAASKNRFRRQLMIAGVTEAVLFPGLDGLGREIRDTFSTLWDL